MASKPLTSTSFGDSHVYTLISDRKIGPRSALSKTAIGETFNDLLDDSFQISIFICECSLIGPTRFGVIDLTIRGIRLKNPPILRIPPYYLQICFKGGFLSLFCPPQAEIFEDIYPPFEGKCIILGVQSVLKMKESDARGLAKIIFFSGAPDGAIKGSKTH